MAKPVQFDLFAVDLPFRKPFKHAAAERAASYSVFVRCVTDAGAAGFGECLPRPYVTGETREGAYRLLRETVLPGLLGTEFASMGDLKAFLGRCDGKAPETLVAPEVPQTAAWSAVDLALLDAFGRAFDEPVRLTTDAKFPESLGYSAVVSADHGLKYLRSLVKLRLYGFGQVKLKVEKGEGEDSLQAARLARRVLGSGCDIRVDANMAWEEPEALEAMRGLAACGIRSFEQPIAAENIDGLARLVRESKLQVMADESMNDRDSLETLVARRACTAVNVRISKCGGLVAAFARCRQALDAGLTVQVGCQVGESSLLSAAHLILVSAVRQVTYAEGCFGAHLLREDPAEPPLQFGYGGRPPRLVGGPGLGVRVDASVLDRWTVERATIGAS